MTRLLKTPMAMTSREENRCISPGRMVPSRTSVCFKDSANTDILRLQRRSSLWTISVLGLPVLLPMLDVRNRM